jgi:hypothetical protein
VLTGAFSFRACRSCPANLTDCFRNQCITADGHERGILTVNHQIPGPSIQVKGINPLAHSLSIGTTQLIMERLCPHSAFTCWALKCRHNLFSVREELYFNVLLEVILCFKCLYVSYTFPEISLLSMCKYCTTEDSSTVGPRFNGPRFKGLRI